MNNTIMQDMNAESGAAIFALNNADLHISNSQFLKCNSTTGGLIDLQNQSNIAMLSSVIEEFIGSAIVGDTVNIELKDVDIWDGTSLHITAPVDCTK